MPDGRECHPCPPRGRCEKGQLTCMKGYFQSGKRCVEDQEVSRYAVFLEARLLDYMQQIKGQHLCKNTSPTIEVGQLHAMGSPVKDDDRPSANRRPKRHQFSPSKFDAAFMLALASLKKNHRDEVTYDPVNETFEAVEGRREFKCIANQFLMAHIGKLFILLVIAILIGKWKFQSYFRKREETQIENCYQEAVEVLRELRVNFNDDEKGDAFMIDTQLREEILGRTTNEKVKLWAKVEKLLRADSRVFCAGPRSIKGMPCYTYEWRGNLRRPSLSRSASRDGFRGYDPDTESKRRLSFGAGSRRQSSAFDAGSPTGTPSGSPTLDPVSPGYRNMLNFWNR